MELAGYSDFDLIGAGGNAHVWRATPDEGGDEVAVKVMRGGGDEAVSRRFERERDLMGSLSEIQSVVPILESGMTEGGDPYLVMPLFRGGSLQKWITENALDWSDAVEHTLTIAKAVVQAHEKQILHLDIKPANILLDEDDNPYLGDFGIAEMMGSTASMSAAMMTPAYTPPERLADEKPTEQTDVYGLGATLYALASGQPPFGANEKTNPAAVITSVLNDPVPVEALPSEVPNSLRNVLLRTMDKDPAIRPSSMHEFVEMLETTIEGGFVPAPAAVHSAETVDAGASTVLRDADAGGASAHSAIDEDVGAADGDNSQSSRLPWFAAVAAAVLLLGGGTLFALTGRGGSEGTTASAQTAELSTDGAAVEEGEAETEESIEGGNETLDDLTEDGALQESQPDDSESPEAEVLGDTEENQDQFGERDGLSGASSTDLFLDRDDQQPDAFEDPSSSFQQVQPVEQDPTTTTSAPSASPTTTVRTTTTQRTATTQRSTTTERAATTQVAAPRASFSTSTSSAETNTTVRFTSTSSGDVDSVSWTFDDDTTGNGSSVNHSWSAAGTYEVRMTARGPGGSDVASRTVTVSAPPASAPPTPDNIGCQYLGNDIDVQWAFSPLPSLVDTYVLEFSNGTTRDIGSQPGPYATTDNFLRAIVAVRDGVRSPASVGSCEAHGGSKPVVGQPGLPTNVSCRFCLLYTSPSPRDRQKSRMPSSA